MAHPSVVINSITYTDCPGVDIPKSGGGTARFHDASEADVLASDVRSGKKFVGANGEDTGSLADNGSTGGTITARADTVVIPAGITTGGTVSIASAEQSKIVAGNIKSGITLLGVSGSLTLPTISQDSTTKILSIS